MNKIFEIAASISTPVELSAFFAAVVFLIFRQILTKNFIPRLNAAIGERILIQLIKSLLILALVAMILGFVAYLAPILQRQNTEATSEQPNLQKLVEELESTSMETRILAASQIANVLPKDRNEADNIVRVLESYINRRGTLGHRSLSESQNRDISAAFLSLSHVLKYSKGHSFDIRPPEFQKLDLASIDLTNSYLYRATFLDSVLNDATLSGADFSNTILSGVQFSRVQAQRIKLISARIQNSCAEESSFSSADLSGIEVSSSDFNGSNFKDANLSSARFENSKLAYANFDGTNLDHSDLRGALEFTTPQFRAARLTDTAMLPNPIFIKSQLTICKVQ